LIRFSGATSYPHLRRELVVRDRSKLCDNWLFKCVRRRRLTLTPVYLVARRDGKNWRTSHTERDARTVALYPSLAFAWSATGNRRLMASVRPMRSRRGPSL